MVDADVEAGEFVAEEVGEGVEVLLGTGVEVAEEVLVGEEVNEGVPVWVGVTVGEDTGVVVVTLTGWQLVSGMMTVIVFGAVYIYIGNGDLGSQF